MLPVTAPSPRDRPMPTREEPVTQVGEGGQEHPELPALEVAHQHLGGELHSRGDRLQVELHLWRGPAADAVDAYAIAELNRLHIRGVALGEVGVADTQPSDVRVRAEEAADGARVCVDGIRSIFQILLGAAPATTLRPHRAILPRLELLAAGHFAEARAAARCRVDTLWLQEGVADSARVQSAPHLLQVAADDTLQ